MLNAYTENAQDSPIQGMPQVDRWGLPHHFPDGLAKTVQALKDIRNVGEDFLATGVFREATSQYMSAICLTNAPRALLWKGMWLLPSCWTQQWTQTKD